jgi:hypothetical protein
MEGFNSSFVPTPGRDARSMLEELIDEFNQLVKPSTEMDEDAPPSRDASSAPRRPPEDPTSPAVDDDGNENHGEGSSQGQGEAGEA